MEFLGQLSPSETFNILSELSHKPNKNLGQNFLIDSNIVRKSLDFAEVCSDDVVVEVGTGLGTLSGALITRAKYVYAVELDKKLYNYISEKYPHETYANFEVLNADALDFPFGSMPDSIKDFKIVANLPYAISTPWMDLAVERRPSRMSLMLQKEAAQRFAAKTDKDFCPISIFVKSAYDICELYKVSASCFYPKPNVDSALLSLSLKQDAFFFKANTKNCIRKIFSQRRKQIGAIAKNISEEYPNINTWLESIDPKLRPEAISIASWQKLNEVL
ncbi:MAG: 16S rRNA (adenine(1518)-N(6)/adenine(1519)-N(6))-dimethyltransferase RsmA [Opitutales bacterium]